MALSSLTELDKYKAAPFPPGYPDTTRTFYSPVDQVHEALKDLLTSANKSIVVAMYGYDDPELNAALQSCAERRKHLCANESRLHSGRRQSRARLCWPHGSTTRSATASRSATARSRRSCT